jgi:hypothetical protein
MAVQLGQWCMGIIGNLIMGTMEPAINMVQMFEIGIGINCFITFLMLIEVPILFCTRCQYSKIIFKFPWAIHKNLIFHFYF